MASSFTHKTIAVFIVAITLAFHSLSAQQNGGLELWSPSGSPPPFDWKFPTGWTTTNATTEFTSAGVNRITDAHRGTYAAQIKTLSIFGTLSRSQLALGNCMLDYSRYQIKAYTGGEPLDMVPQNVSFFYKLTVGDVNEYAVADILIKHPSGSSVPDTLFYQSVALQSVDAYTEVNIPIPAVGIDIASDSIVILFSSNDTNEVGLNFLYLDDVSIDFTSAVPTPSSEQSSITIYPNPIRSGDAMIIRHPNNLLHDVKIMDAAGKIVERCFTLNQDLNETRIDRTPKAPGWYSLWIDGKYGERFLVIQ